MFRNNTLTLLISLQFTEIQTLCGTSDQMLSVWSLISEYLQTKDNSREQSYKNNLHGNHRLSELKNQNSKVLRMNSNIVKSKFSISVSSKLVCILKVWKWRMKYVVAFLNFYLH